MGVGNIPGRRLDQRQLLGLEFDRLGSIGLS